MECNANSRPMPLDICGTVNCRTGGKKSYYRWTTLKEVIINYGGL